MSTTRISTHALALAAASLLGATLACSSLSRPQSAAAHDTKPRAVGAKRGLVPGGGSEGDFEILPGTKIPSIEARHSIRNATSRPLSQIAQPPHTPPGGSLRDIEMEKGPDAFRPPAPRRHDPVLQSQAGAGMPTPDVNFEGVPNVNGVQPADTTMAIGPNHVFQWVNLAFQVFDKSGNSLAGPFDGNTLFTDLGGDCAAINGGDIIVLYDQFADRWILTQLAPAIFGAHGNHQCIAVSTGADPLGSYYLYDYLYGDALNDYPKFGVWPDAYYMTAREFGGEGGFTMTVTAFDRTAMLAGQPFTAVFVSLNNGGFDGLLPAYIDGPNPPPGTVLNPDGTAAESPEEILMGVDPQGVAGPNAVIHMYKMHPDFTTPANSTFTGPVDFPVADYNPVSFFQGVPEPGGGSVEALGWILYRLPYRNFGTHESLVLYHDANDESDRVVPRWYEFRDPYGEPIVYQQGTYAPDDGVNRWMGSIAMDGNGNIGVGYGVSDDTATYPGIRYAGRLATDPLNELSQGEAELIAGQGTFLGSRWGDYSMMAIDPTDDCTFWYSHMYIGEPGQSNWQTRVGSFKYPSCFAPGYGTVEGTVTDGTNPLAGVRVRVTGSIGGGGGVTDAAGHYAFDLPAASYSLTAAKYGYSPSTQPGVVVTVGGQTTQDFTLSTAPSENVSGTVTDGSGAGWPLYAKIVITATGAPTFTVFTDPVTGAYSLPLVTGNTFKFAVTAVAHGYSAGGGNLQVDPAGGGGVVADWTLSVDPTTCDAPGYGNGLSGGSTCLPGPGGLVVGNVLDANTTLGLNGATVSVLPQPGGDTTTTFATPEDPAQPDGMYIVYANAGAQSLAASLDLYTPQTSPTNVVSHGAVRLDFHLAAGLLEASPRPLSARVDPGQSLTSLLDLINSGGAGADFELIELDVPPPAASGGTPHFAGPAKVRDALARIPEGARNARSSAGLAMLPDSRAAASPLAGGNVLHSYPTGLIAGWGIAFDTDHDDFWISNAGEFGGDNLDYRYLSDGTLTGDTIDDSPWVEDYAADGAFNARTGMLWRVNVGGDNCIYELDPFTRAATGNKICALPWSGISQRGLAYDVKTDTYYTGGWNDGVIYHVDGAGNVLDSTSVAIPIAGLAYDSRTGHLFALTNHAPPPQATLDVFVFDVKNGMAVVGGFNVTQNGQPLPGLLNHGGAGLEIDCTGHLWLVDQTSQTILEVDSGEANACAFNDVPWLSENVTSGTVAATSTFPIACTFDSAGLLPGLRQAQLKVLTNTPYRVAAVPVDLTVRFLDVADDNIFQAFIYGAAGAGVMPGCDAAAFLFCPTDLVTRADMAGFILRAVHGAGFVPAPYAGAFADVQAGDYNADYIQSFFDEGYTVGCGGGNFCPDAVHTRGQTAVFILKGEHGTDYVPPACDSTHEFDDVACPATPEAPFGDWIGQLFVEGVTAGCGGNDFCPTAGIPNQQMATFLVRAFGLPHL
jgi:hypothetical protein